ALARAARRRARPPRPARRGQDRPHRRARRDPEQTRRPSRRACGLARARASRRARHHQRRSTGSPREDSMIPTSRSLTLGMLLGALLLAGRADAQTVTRGPYLQIPTPNGIVVRWRTDVPTDSRVAMGT